MKKIRTIGALALLLGFAATVGCGAEGQGGDELLGEPISTTEEGLIILGPAFIDSTNCNGARTQCLSMHCCPGGHAMSGLNVGENIFECRSIIGARTDRVGCYTERSFTRRVEGYDVRACPDGFYMTGFHAGANAAACCPYGFTPNGMLRYLDGANEPATQRGYPAIKSPWPWAGTCGYGYLHVCPSGVMEGFSTGNNMNVCQP